MDLAEIGLKADSSDLTKANTALDTFAGKAADAEKASDKLADATKKTSQGMAEVDKTVVKTTGSLRLIGVAIGAAAGAFAGFFTAKEIFQNFIDQTKEGEVIQQQLAVALKSTGAASGQTLDSLEKQADALQNLSTYSSSAIEQAQSILLTFTNLGQDVFPKATSAAADLAARFGTDIVSAAQQVGRALNDPARGLQSLTRAGITFSDSQRQMIKSMLDANNVAGAQKIILDKLTVAFGGSAAAARDTLGGALAALGNAWDNLFQLSGPAVAALRGAIESLIQAITDPAFIQFAQTVGVGIFSALNLVVQGMTMLASAIPVVINALVPLAPAFLLAFGPAIFSAITSLASAIGGPLITSIRLLFAVIVANPLTILVGGIIIVISRMMDWQKTLTGLIQLYGELLQSAGMVANLFKEGSGTDLINRGIQIRLNADDAVEKLKDYAGDLGDTVKQSLGVGGDVASNSIYNGMVKGGKDAAGALKLTLAQQVENEYQRLNGTAIKAIGDTLIDGGKYILNQVTGEVTKASGDLKKGLDDGGKSAGTTIQHSMETGGQQAAKSMQVTLSGFTGSFSSLVQGFAGSLTQAYSAFSQLMTATISQAFAQANLLNAQGREANANAKKALAEAQLTNAQRMNLNNTGSGSMGSSYSSGGTGNYLDKTSAAALGLDTSGMQDPNKKGPRFTGFLPAAGGVGFANGGEFEVPGSGGGDRTRVGFWATPGENVKISPKGEDSKPKVELKIENRFDPNATLDAISTFDGHQRVINVIASNREVIASILGVA